MTSISANYKSLVEDIATEYFLPILNLIGFIKYLSSSESRSKKFLEKIELLEDRMVGLTQEIATTNKEIRGQRFISSSIESNLKVTTVQVLLELVNKFHIELVNKLHTKELEPSCSLSPEAAMLGLANIEYLYRGISKIEGVTPHLFAINKGGGLLASYLGHRMNLRERYIVKCDYNVDHDKIYCEEREKISGSIFLIDDVVRTGKTMGTIKNYLRDKYPNNKIFSTVLVTSCPNENIDSICEFVDYSPWYTKHSSVTLPWSQAAENAIDSSDYFNDLDMDQMLSRIEVST